LKSVRVILTVGIQKKNGKLLVQLKIEGHPNLLEVAVRSNTANQLAKGSYQVVAATKVISINTKAAMKKR
jgi:hypothetical protein